MAYFSSSRISKRILFGTHLPMFHVRHKNKIWLLYFSRYIMFKIWFFLLLDFFFSQVMDCRIIWIASWCYITTTKENCSKYLDGNHCYADILKFPIAVYLAQDLYYTKIFTRNIFTCSISDRIFITGQYLLLDYLSSILVAKEKKKKS